MGYAFCLPESEVIVRRVSDFEHRKQQARSPQFVPVIGGFGCAIIRSGGGPIASSTQPQAGSIRHVGSIRHMKDRAVTLQKIAAVNEQVASGPGLAPEHLIPLCKYHNRSLARDLIHLLKDNGICPEIRTTRMFCFFSVKCNDYSTASKLLKEFEVLNPDTPTKSFSRDFDAIILVGVVTVFVVGISFFLPSYSGLEPVALLVSGISCSIVIERINRNYRYLKGKHFSLGDIMSLTAIVAVNFAIWKLVV